MTLTEFLLARIAEDEDTARRAREENPDLSWEASQIYDGVYSVDLGPSTHPDADSNYATDMGVDLRMPREMALHIERQQPARALAKCKATRRILDEYESYRSAASKMALCHLASVYADHPDFRDEWKS